MIQRILNILAQGPMVVAVARASIDDVNAAYLTAHGVIARALSAKENQSNELDRRLFHVVEAAKRAAAPVCA